MLGEGPAALACACAGSESKIKQGDADSIVCDLWHQAIRDSCWPAFVEGCNNMMVGGHTCPRVP